MAVSAAHAPPTTSTAPGIGAMRTGRDALTTLTMEVATRIATVLLSIVAARVLDPMDLGTLGLSVVIVGLVSMLCFFPENAAVILRVAAGDQELALAGCLMRIGVTAALTLLVTLSLDAIASVLGGDATGAGKLHRLTALLLCQPWLEALASYPRILLRRRLDLGYVAGMHLVGSLAFAGTAVAFLGHGFGHVSVVWAQLLSGAVVAALAWLRVARTSLFGRWGWPSQETWSALVAESVRLFTGGFGGYVGERLDNLLVAGKLGPASAGFYALAWNVARMPVNILAQVVHSVIVPVLAAGKEDKDRVAQTLRNTVRFSYLLLSFGGAVLLFLGPTLVELIFGAKWRPVGPALRVMAFSILNAPIQFAAGAYLVTTSRAHIVGLATSAHIAAQFLLIPLLTERWGVLGAAYADLAGTTLVTAVLCVGVRLAAGPLHWLDVRTAVRSTFAALLAVGGAVMALPGAHDSGTYAVAALSASLLMFPALVIALGGLGGIKDAVSLIRGWLSGLGGKTITRLREG